MKGRTAVVILLALAWSGLSFAQGVQSGAIRGTVRDQDGLPVPGVTVTTTAAVLQGTRIAVTDTAGGYVLPNLPPGDYQVTFQLSGFSTVTESANVLLGLTVEQKIAIRPAGVAETVRVVAGVPAPIATPVVGANFRHEEIEQLATPRTIQGIAQLAPALTENAPQVGQIVINGGFAFDSVFMINGVDIGDNIFSTPQSLFIEDAIQETQVLTSGISAEYGRFGGGVVNAITKSGGDSFSGSGRINFLNPSWSTATPFEVTRGTDKTAHPDTLSKTYEGTFGGPLMKNHLWFFTAGRYASVDGTVSLPQTGIVLPSTSLNKRGEVKLTGTVSSHTIQGGYLNNPSTRTNNSGVQSLIIDPRSEVDRSIPNWYYYTNYHGVLRNSLIAEAQYSERRFRFDNDGGTSTNIFDSPFFALGCACVYNAPFGDVADPMSRNNRQITGSVTGYWMAAGRHQTKAGYEFFRSQLTGGGSQSATSYVFHADFLTNAAGAPVLDSTGRLIPVFVPGESLVDFFPGAVKNATLNVNNNSFYLQDHWAINGRWSADLGARFENVRAISTGDIVSVSTNRIVPRLALGYDIQGDGNHVVHVTYGQYSGRYNEAQIGQNSPVGRPDEFLSAYRGPAGQGATFAPGFDPKNYPISSANTSPIVPQANVFMDPNLKSPLTHELSVSYGLNFGRERGYGEVAYVARKTHGLIEDFSTISDGFTHVVASGVDAGLFSNIVYRNTDLAHREYQGMVFQSRFRVSNHWNVNGHYTLQIKNDGNYEGEASGIPGATSAIGSYPEAFNAARSYPDGRLQDFQRHRLRLWSIYNLDMGRAGDASVSGLWRVDSARVYSLAARNQGLTAEQRSILAAAGYPDGPGPVSVFFGDRGSEEFAGFGVLDVSFNYNVPVFRSLRPWVKLDVYNLLNNQKLIAWNTTISPDPSSSKDNLGYATGYVKGATFGTATGNTVTNLNVSTVNAYPVAFSGAAPGGRTFQAALGFRF